MLPHARAALAAVDSARLAVDELAGLVRGHVAVGMLTACASLELQDLLAGFHRDHPGVEITLSEAINRRVTAGRAAPRLVHHADGVDQLGGLGVLDQEATRAGADGVEDVGVLGLLVTLIATILCPGLDEAAAHGRALAVGGATDTDLSVLLFPPIVSTTLLLAAAVLAVYRPWGTIRRALPRSAERPVTQERHT